MSLGSNGATPPRSGQVRPVLSDFEQGLLDAEAPARVRFQDLEARPDPTGAADTRFVTARVVVERADETPPRQEYRMWIVLSRDGDRWQIRAMRQFTNRRPARR